MTEVTEKQIDLFIEQYRVVNPTLASAMIELKASRMALKKINEDLDRLYNLAKKRFERK